MAKNSKRQCPDCYGIELGLEPLFGTKGNGLCNDCKGTGLDQLGTGIVSFVTLDLLDTEVLCKTCLGKKQCQTCGGCGYEYYDEAIDQSNEVENDNTDYDYDNSSTEVFYTNTYDSNNFKTKVGNYQSEGSYSGGNSTVAWIILIVIVGWVLSEVFPNSESVETSTVPASFVEESDNDPIIQPPDTTLVFNEIKQDTPIAKLPSISQTALTLDKKTSFSFTMDGYGYDYSDEKFLYHYLKYFDEKFRKYSDNEFELRRKIENAKIEIKTLIENLNYTSVYYRDQIAFLGKYDFNSGQFEFDPLSLPRYKQYPYFYIYNFPSLGFTPTSPTSTNDASNINLKNFEDFNRLKMKQDSAELLLTHLHRRQVYIRYYYSFLKEIFETTDGGRKINNGVFCYVYLVEIWGDKEMRTDKIAVLKAITNPPEYLAEVKSKFDENE